MTISSQSLASHWPCGHERTPENTQSVGSAGVRCRKCRRRINQASRDRLKVDDPETRRLEYKVNYLPIQIANVREKLARLEQEARDLGMHDLVEAR